MIIYSDAKINIGLQILRKRTDGFHDISTLMVPVPFRDIIEINIVNNDNGDFKISQSGFSIPGRPEENLCYKGWKLFCKAAGKIRVRIHLHKRIPVGSGLGGGSSNGTAVLRGLNALSGNILKKDELYALAKQLGSDCSIFVENKPALAEGRGDILTDTSLNISNLYIVLLFPGRSINTAWAYKNVVPDSTREDLNKLLPKPKDTWKRNITNDFEQIVFKDFPKIERLKAELYMSGAFFASLSGSGSAVYGLYKEKADLGTMLRNNLLWEGWI